MNFPIGLRDLSDWDILLSDYVLIQKFLERDDFGNPTYESTGISYPCRIDMDTYTRGGLGSRSGSASISRGNRSALEGELQPIESPDCTIYCNLFNIDVDDWATLSSYNNQTLVITSVQVFEDEIGPHHLELMGRFLRV